MIVGILHARFEVPPDLSVVSLPRLHRESLRLRLDDQRAVPEGHEHVNFANSFLTSRQLRVGVDIGGAEHRFETISAEPFCERTSISERAVSVLCVFAHPIERGLIDRLGQYVVVEEDDIFSVRLQDWHRGRDVEVVN